MNKFIVNRFGLISLTIIFLILYGYFSVSESSWRVGQNRILNSTLKDDITIGELGGFHLLENLTYSDERTYYRIGIHTRLNRSTVIDDSIVLPRTHIRLLEASEPIVLNGQPSDTTGIGGYRIQADISDIGTADLSGEETEEVFVGEERADIYSGPLTELWLVQPPDDSALQVVVGLSSPSKFIVSDDGSGTIFIDVLK